MSSGSSLRAGWLIATPMDDDARIEDALHDMVQGVTGLPGKAVRPRWQPRPPKTPGEAQDWCALGVLGAATPAGAGGMTWHCGREEGTRLEVHERLTVLFSFYGPNARKHARMLRDGMMLEQNRAQIRDAANLAFVACGEITQAHELVNMHFLPRQDVQMQFNRGPIPATPAADAEGAVDIKNLQSVKACGLCGRSR